MATINSPVTHAALETATFRLSAALVRGAVRLRLAERFTLRSGGAVALIEDLAGSGSDTARLRFYDSIGYKATMTASASETSTTTLSDIVAEVQDIALARYDYGVSESWQSQILATDGELDIEGLGNLVTDVFEANWMDVLADTIMGAAVDYGTSGADMTFDDYLDAIAYFRTLTGFMPGRNLFSMLHGQQFVDLGNSVRAEPNYQFPEATDEKLAARGPGFQFDWLGASNYQSNRVNASGGNRHGAFFSSQAIGYVIGSTSRVKVPKTGEFLIIPDIATVLSFEATGNGAQTKMYQNSWMGQAIIDASQIRGMVTDE